MREAVMRVAILMALGSAMLLAAPARAQTPGDDVPPLAPATPAPAPAAPAAPAAAGPTQTFPLKNGSTVQGRVVEQQPGRYVVIETADGWQVTIPWEQIGPPPAKPAPPPKPPQPEQPAAEQEAPKAQLPTGLRLGARLAFAFPYGKIQSGATVSDTFGTAYPLELELGAQIGSVFYIGAYGAYAPEAAGSEAKTACGVVDCSVYGARLGLETEFRFSKQGPRSPWIGYGIGWSADEIDLSESDGKHQLAVGGIDIANITGGLDFRIGDSLMIGPYGGVSASMYLYEAQAVDGTGRNKSIHETALHGFVQLGARVAFFPF